MSESTYNINSNEENNNHDIWNEDKRNYVCVCACNCRDRYGFATLAPYKIGHSLTRKKIFVCQHFASCKFSGKTCILN